MNGRSSFSELRGKLPPERQANIAEKAAAMAATMTLAELRQARRLTQEALSDTLKVGQAAVAKMEKRTDMYVGNLRRFVEAMGGELEVVARFPEGSVTISNFESIGREI